jgi:hypothetical protein
MMEFEKKFNMDVAWIPVVQSIRNKKCENSIDFELTCVI